MDKISQEQKEVLGLILDELETPRRIAIRRQTSIQAVYKTIAKLKKKRLLLGQSSRGFNRGGVVTPFLPNLDQKKGRLRVEHVENHIISYHASQFKIIPLNTSSTYDRIRKTSTRLEVDGNVVLLYDKCLILCAREGLDFRGATELEAIGKATRYWTKIISDIEFRLNILLKKEFLILLKLK